MTATEQISIDTLDDKEQRSEAWTGYQGQRRQGTIPRGTYEATLQEVAVIRKRGGGWALRMLARTVGLDRYVLAWRGLADDGDDPYDLNAGQLKGLQKFAAGMGIQTPAPAQVIVMSLRGLIDGQVTAKVVQTAAGQTATLTRDVETPEVLPSTSGAVSLRGVNPTGDALKGAAGDAFESHTLVVEGLRASRLGLAQAARGCAELIKSEGWVALGFPTIGEYLAAPEITVSRSQFYRLADIWTQYVLEGGVGPERLSIEESKLEVPLPALKQGLVSADQAISDAEAMPRHDLRQHYRELLGNDEQDQGEGSERDAEPDAGDGFYDPTAETPAGGSEPVVVRDGERDETAETLIALKNRVLDLEDTVAEQETRARAAEDRERTLRAELEARPQQTDLEGMAFMQELSAMLERVLLEVGRPEQKRMSKALRGDVLELLRRAPDHGLDVEAVDVDAT